MTDFLFLLAKINLAMGGAILAVALLRRPVRAAFHARIAYGLWLLVPAAMLASLLPPRAMIAQSVNAAIPLSFRTLPTTVADRWTQAAPFDWSLLLFMVWLAGMGAMALIMSRQQRHFHLAEREGVAGPAVTGFLHPRIVIPLGFATQFNPSEQAAILAHEAAHLARQDARINAVAALLRCLCWFNPLVHLGALWLRRDQELACDASAVRQVARLDYANALLKSQMRALALPLGCTWPGAEHPLTERVALLSQPAPNAARRRAGMALLVLLTLGGGAAAWAAQPAQSAPKSFKGKLYYAEQVGDSGPTLFMSVESDQDDKFSGGKDKSRGYVVMYFPSGVAQADSGSSDFRMDQNLADHKTVTLRGNVKLLIGGNIMSGGLRGEKLVFDARSGMLDLDGKSFSSGMPKYVPCMKNCVRFSN